MIEEHLLQWSNHQKYIFDKTFFFNEVAYLKSKNFYYLEGANKILFFK